VPLPSGKVAWVSVAELRPAPAVCIVDTDLRLEFDAPTKAAREATVLKVDGEAVTAELQSGHIHWYRFVAPTPTSVFARKDVIIKCIASTGDPDVYATCDEANKFPSMV